MELTEGHKALLERIHALDNPDTADLKEDDEVVTHYSPKSVGKTLRKLADQAYVQIDRGKPNQYSLTEDGYHVVKHRRDKRERRLKEAARQEDNLPFKDAVELFEDYFTIDEIQEDIIQRSLENRGAIIDYQHLERVETQLADEVLDQPVDMIEAAETALAKLSAVDGEMPVRFSNLPEYREKPIRQINTGDIGKLVTIPGIVMKASISRPVLVNAVFECTSCGDRVEKDQRNLSKKSSPYKCDCGNRKFESIDEEFEDVRILKLQEKPDSPDQKNIKVKAFGSLALDEQLTEIKPGTSVKITGVVKAEEPASKTNPYYKKYIRAVDITLEQNKWDEIELTEEDRERNQEIVDAGPIRVFQESVAMDRVMHRHLLKEAFLLYLLGKTPYGNLHVLAMGEPGTGKSQLMNWAERHMPKTVKASATGSSAVGLTATVTEDQDFGGYVAKGGSLTLADGGYHITDEFDKLEPEHVSCFNDALQDGHILLNKGDIVNLKLDANVSEWASANPREYDYFDPDTPKYQQIPIHPRYDATKDRFDVIIGVTEYGASTDKKQDVVRHILRRDRDEYDGAVPEYDPDELVTFVTEASRLNPEMTDEAEEVIQTVYFALLKQQGPQQHLITNRKLEALKRLSIAYARAHLSEEVTEEHAQMACDFFRRSLESIDFQVGKDSFGEINPKEKTDLRKIREAIEKISQENDKDAASIDDISLVTGLSNDRIEEVLKQTDNQSEFYNPKGDLWKSL